MKKKIKSTIAATTIALSCALTTAPASACELLRLSSQYAGAMYDATGNVGFRELAFSYWQAYQSCERAQ